MFCAAMHCDAMPCNDLHCNVMTFLETPMPKTAESTTNIRVSKSPPGVKRVRVRIKGIAPGVMFQGKGLMEQDGGKPGKPRPPEEEARLRAHWTGSGKGKQLCVPAVMLYNCFCKAAGFFKFKGNMKMSTIVASTVAFEVDEIPLGTDQFETHVEYVRIPPKTGAMVKVGRPLLREWSAEFYLIVDDEMYDAAKLEEIIRHAGKMIGIGAGRPELKRPYGKFIVDDFQIQ